MKFLCWLLRLFGLTKLAAALEGAKAGIEQVESQEATRINQEADDEIASLHGMSDSELDDTIQQLRADAKARASDDSG